MLRRPCAEAEHDGVATDVALLRSHLRHAAGRHVVAGDLHARQDAHAVIAAFLAQARDRLARPRIAAHLLVQDDVDAVGLEVGPDPLEELLRVAALVEIGRIPDPRLARVQSLVVGRLIRLARRHVPDLLKAEGHRVVHPHVDRMPQDRVDRLGHVQVAHASAGDARRAGAGTGLVEYDDVGARAGAARLELHREMPCGRQAVDSGADDDVTCGSGNEVAHRCGFLTGFATGGHCAVTSRRFQLRNEHERQRFADGRPADVRSARIASDRRCMVERRSRARFAPRAFPTCPTGSTAASRSTRSGARPICC